MNKILQELKIEDNYKETENGGVAYKSTLDAVYDMFAFGGAYRTRSEADCILLFKKAYAENPELALKCLFYLRDCRGGQGERRFFRICFKWLCTYDTKKAEELVPYVAEYGRYDDLIYATIDTPVEEKALSFIEIQLKVDLECLNIGEKQGISLLGKWLPSENTSSLKTKITANKIRKYLKMSHKDYRKVLSKLRARINILERLMSENRWTEIEFDKIPSKAGLKYKNAFARRDIIAKKYETFAKDTNTTVNADTLYPYEIVDKALKVCYRNNLQDLKDTDRLMTNKYWDNQIDYFNGAECNLMCVIDTSGSMCGVGAAAPMNVAIGLGLYCAERLKGPFHNHYISFASKPQLIECEGVDFVDKVDRIYKTNLVDNTNLTAVFDLLKDTALKTGAQEDLPSTIVVISDMEIDSATRDYWHSGNEGWWTKDNAKTEMDKVRAEWAAAGLKMPSLVFWNVEARNNTILDLGDNVSLVSGASPSIFKQVITGVKGKDLMIQTLTSERYNVIK